LPPPALTLSLQSADTRRLIDSLGIVVVPVLALLLYWLLPFPQEPTDSENGSGEPPADGVPHVQPAPSIDTPRATIAPAPLVRTVLSLVRLSVLGLVAVSAFRRQR